MAHHAIRFAPAETEGEIFFRLQFDDQSVVMCKFAVQMRSEADDSAHELLKRRFFPFQDQRSVFGAERCTVGSGDADLAFDRHQRAAVEGERRQNSGAGDESCFHECVSPECYVAVLFTNGIVPADRIVFPGCHECLLFPIGMTIQPQNIETACMPA